MSVSMQPNPAGFMPAGFLRKEAVLVPVKRLLLGAIVLLLVATAARADERNYDLDNGTEAVLGAVGLGLFGAGSRLIREPGPSTPAGTGILDPARLNAWDRGAVDNWSPGSARASDVLAVTSLAAPLVLLADARGRNQADVLGVMYLETTLLNSGLTYLLKNAVGRPRPYAYNDDPEIPPELRRSRTTGRSFPSGHTSTAFASLVFLATVHGRLYPDSAGNDWIWGGCLATASVTGYLRYAAGRHFPTDILAGASVGALVGWLVPHLHEWPPDSEVPSAGKGPVRETFVGFTWAF